MKKFKIKAAHAKFCKMASLLQKDNVNYLILECEKDDVLKQKFSYVYILPSQYLTLSEFIGPDYIVAGKCNGIVCLNGKYLVDIINGFGHGLYVRARIIKNEQGLITSERHSLRGYFSKESNGILINAAGFYFVDSLKRMPDEYKVGELPDILSNAPIIEIIDLR